MDSFEEEAISSSEDDQLEESEAEEFSSENEQYAHKRALDDAPSFSKEAISSSEDDRLEESEADEFSSENEQEYAHKRALDDGPSSAKRLKTENGEGDVQQKKNGLFKPPTAEELNRLQETENLFKSNLFRLQIEELLQEVKVKQKYQTLFNKWLEDFAQFLSSLPRFEDVKVSELVKSKAKTGQQKFINALIDVHRSNLNTDQDVVLKFVKPDKYNIVGLRKINALLGPKLTVDIAIAMPKKCFLEKDFLNNRYLVKRAYYLSYVYLFLKKKNLCSDLSHIDKNSVLHIILPTSEKIQVNLHVTAVEGTFKLSRFEPDKNNIREHVFDDFRDVDKIKLKEFGTPFYNSRLLRDLTVNANWDFAESTLKDLKNVQDGIKLLSVWLQQRGLYSDDGFSETLLVQTLVYLTLKRKINKHMSSYQVIRNFWVFLSTTNWHDKPISICEDVKPDKFLAFCADFDVVFLDQSGLYNLAAFLNNNVYMKARSEAELAIEFLDDIKFDSFRALFMTKMNLEIQYDVILILKDDNSFKNIYNAISPTEKYKYVGCFQNLIIKNILNSLCKGLNKRIVNIVPILNEQTELTEICFGITLNPSEAFKVTEKGPPSNSREAAEFTQFWGKLSECRRFADGSICEAVYFPAATLQEKRQIFKQVISFVVQEKLKVQQHIIIADDFEKMLVLNNYITPFRVGTNEEASLKVIRIFDDLARKLRECTLPLEITSVQGASEVFSYTSLFPPIPTSYRWGGKLTTLDGNNIIFNKKAKFGSVPKYSEPIECVIQLGMNSKWPHNLEALQNLKIGFYLELSNILSKEQIISAVKPGFIDVFYQGLVFRFRLYNPREISALKKSLDSDGVTTFKDTNESVELEKNLVILPRIVSALHGIQSENPSYGPSTALIKRWLRSQLIDEYYIPDVVVDLLNASLYLSGAPYNSPNLPQVAFLRFLYHIAEFDWNLHLAVVNFNDELTKDVIDSFETDFQQNRQKYPPLYIITPYDDGKSLFSKECTTEVLRRLLLLAKATCEVIQANILKQSLTIPQLFVPNLTGYNVLIHLKPLLNPRRHQQVSFAEVNENTIELQDYDQNESTKMPIVGFNPVENYLRELRENYGKFALFFYDPYGGNVIGVLWQPKALESKPFKVSHIEGRELVDGSLILDTDAIIEGFCVLGDGLVKTVHGTINK